MELGIAALKLENPCLLLAEPTCLERVLMVLIKTIAYHHFDFRTSIKHACPCA